MSIDDQIDRLIKLETAKVSIEEAAKRKGLVPSAIAELIEQDRYAEQFLAAGKTPDEWIDALARAKPHILPDVLSKDEVERGRIAFASLRGQGEYLRANGQEQADKMAKALGVRLGTLVKTVEHSDNGGQQRKPAAPRAETNPFKRDPVDHAEIASLIIRIGSAATSRLAASAGTDLAGRPLRQRA